MKYSQNLPKLKYTTTIGNFDVVDITSYYEIEDLNFQKNKINLDKSETFIEASYRIFDDVNLFWLFLYANKTINPFTLTKLNSSDLLKSEETLTGLEILQYTGSDTQFVAGSILTPFFNPGGSSWSYGSTGTFSLTGGFALVDSFNTFSKRPILKPPQNGFTFYESEEVSGLLKGIYQDSSFTEKTSANKYSQYAGATATIDSIKSKPQISGEINYVNSNNNTYFSVKSEYPLVKKGTGKSGYEIRETGGETFTFEEIAIDENIQIDCYVPSSIKYSKFKKIIQNYKV